MSQFKRKRKRTSISFLPCIISSSSSSSCCSIISKTTTTTTSSKKNDKFHRFVGISTIVVILFLSCFWMVFGFRGFRRSTPTGGLSLSSSIERSVDSSVLEYGDRHEHHDDEDDDDDDDGASVSVENRLRGALWGFFSGDALAAPSHWYYGGTSQIRRDYGRMGITDYVKPKKNLSGSIMNKSNVNGGGRGSFEKTGESESGAAGISIIGDVINHGKRDLWDPNKSVHYHATLQAGENTLEAQLARVLMKSIVSSKGSFDADHFRRAYINFMTTPGSHNDAYASTCHRMFFANLRLRALSPEDCPDNDHHNVDTIDGLVLPTITAMAIAARTIASSEPSTTSVSYDQHVVAVADAAAATAAVTRRSDLLEETARQWSRVISASLSDDVSDDDMIHKVLSECASSFGMDRTPSAKFADQMTACYLRQSFPPTLDTLVKYIPLIRHAHHHRRRRHDDDDADSNAGGKNGGSGNGVRAGLLANANVGGENVHRGSLLGAVLGARAGFGRYSHFPNHLREGLYDKDALENEIEAFIRAVLLPPSAHKDDEEAKT